MVQAGAAVFLPRRAFGSSKLNIAAVGVGGMGKNYVAGCASENIVALCDVDRAYAAKAFATYPSAKTYTDFRRMLDAEKSIDAVIVGTPDHTHAEVALAAISLGKHVYCAKPMTRTVSECRRLVRTAREAKVATQMSVQSCGSDDSLTTVEWVRAGAVGEVKEVHVWSDRPVWPQALARPSETPAVPDTLDWKLWLGAAPPRPYHPIYHPFNWRGWTDFGTGGLGDMGCHTLHVILQAIDAGPVTAVSATSSIQMLPAYANDADRNWTRSRKARFDETFPAASIVTWEFGTRPRVIWYDGGLKPPRPVDLPAGQHLGNDGILFVGSKGVLLSGFTGKPRPVPGFDAPPKTLARSKGHYKEWIEAAKGGPPAMCEFGFGGRLTEIALLGCIAVRTGKHLTWDAEAGRFTNDADTNQFL